MLRCPKIEQDQAIRAKRRRKADQDFSSGAQAEYPADAPAPLNISKPNTSGNPSGRPARSKLRNVRQSIVDVYMQEVSVGDGRSKRKVPAIVVLHEQLLRNALKGSDKAAALAAKFAAQFHVNDVKDEVSLDLTRLTSKERDILRKAGPILQKAKTIKPT